ncbi:MAG: ArsA family ATPase [Chloroflexi bacterium]|nr:ArsA family ATPase [Chloroflexota bacterium]
MKVVAEGEAVRIILYTGKGGVGKTSVAAATALRAAEQGKRTLVLSTDPAHSLADSFDVPLGPDPVQVSKDLWGQEIEVLREMERHWSTVQEWLAALMQWQGMDEVVAEELAVLPGMEELVGLLYVAQYYDSDAWDVLIIDCAPTGETLRLLSFPEMARWYMNHIFPIQRRTAKALGPFAKAIIGLPSPNGKVFAALEQLYRQLDRVHGLLTQPEVASVRLVVNAEKMVVKETQRTFTYLNLYGYHTDLVVCNRLIPPEVDHSFFNNWRASQAQYLEFIHECFSPIPVLTAPLLDREVVGLDPLREFSMHIFGEQDPVQLFYRGQMQQVVRDGPDRLLKVPVPFASKEDVKLVRNGEELAVQVGWYRRNLHLPRMLAVLDITQASLGDGTLVIRFRDDRPQRVRRPARQRD